MVRKTRRDDRSWVVDLGLPHCEHDRHDAEKRKGARISVERRPLSHSGAAFRNHEETPRLSPLEEQRKMPANKAEHGRTPGTRRPEEHDAGVQGRRIGTHVADALVHGQEHFLAGS
jgi:hypothetical protein